MPWLNDLITVLESDGVGTENSDIFATTNVTIPRLESGYATLHLVQTSGDTPTNTQNAVLTPAYMNPTAQIVARGTDPVRALAKLQLAYNSLFKIRNQFINSGWYVWVKPMGDLGDLGRGEDGQCRFVLNVTGRKRP